MIKSYAITAVAVTIFLNMALQSAQSYEIPIDNPGFEEPVLIVEDGYAYSMDNEGWGYFENDGYLGAWNITITNYISGMAPEGDNVGWVEPGSYVDDGGTTNLEDDVTVYIVGGFAQVLTNSTLKAGMLYTLTVEVGNARGYDWPGYMVQILAGGTPHTPGTGTNYTGPVSGGTLLAEDSNTVSIVEGTFEKVTLTYRYDPADAALLGDPLQIRLLAIGFEEVDFDDLSLVATPVSTGTLIILD